jgi:hypothetical protein
LNELNILPVFQLEVSNHLTREIGLNEEFFISKVGKNVYLFLYLFLFKEQGKASAVADRVEKWLFFGF